MWDAATGSQLHSVECPPGNHRAIASNGDGSRIALAAADGSLRIYDTATGQELFTLTGHAGHVMAVAFSHDGRLIVSAGFDDATVRVWDVDRGVQLHVIQALPTLTHLAFSPDRERLAAVGFHGVVRIWSADSWQDVFSLPGLAPQRPGDFGYNARVAFSRDGSRIAATNWDVVEAAGI